MKAVLSEADTKDWGQWTRVVKELTVCLIQLLCTFKQASFFKRPPFFFFDSLERHHKLCSHSAYQSVPHVQWSTKPPPGPHEIFMPAEKLWCHRFQLECPVPARLQWHSSSVGSREPGGFRWITAGLTLSTCGVNCEIRASLIVKEAPVRFYLRTRGLGMLHLCWLVF